MIACSSIVISYFWDFWRNDWVNQIMRSPHLTIEGSCTYHILSLMVDNYGRYTCDWCFGGVNPPIIFYNLGQTLNALISYILVQME
jgi:hypothetical protein